MQKALVLLFQVALGAAIGVAIALFALAPFLSELRGNRWVALALILGLPLFLFFDTAIHELGHVVGGLLCRFKFRSVTIGPVHLTKMSTGWNLRWNRRGNVLGGLAMLFPQDDKNLRLRFVFYTFAGPLASLILAITCWAVSRSGVFNAFVGLCAEMTAWKSMYTFLITIYPKYKQGGFKNDGAQILGLLRKESSQIELALLTAATTLQSGGRPSELRIGLIEQAIRQLRGKEDLLFVGLNIYPYYHWADQQEIDQAAMHLKQVEEFNQLYPAGFRESLWAISAFHAAFYDQDLAVAKAHLEKYSPSSFTDAAEQHWLDASIAVLENDMQRATNQIRMARELLAELLEPGLALYYEDCLKILEQQIESP